MSIQIFIGTNEHDGTMIHDSEEKKPPEIKIYEILKYPDPILSAPCDPISSFDDNLMVLIGDMWATMRATKWGRAVGLAAPQIGKSLQLFIANGSVYINPKVTWVTKVPKQIQREGCYSGQENHFEDKHRHASIRMEWQDQLGNHHVGRFNGFAAYVIQHEMDHINIEWEKGL